MVVSLFLVSIEQEIYLTQPQQTPRLGSYTLQRLFCHLQNTLFGYVVKPMALWRGNNLGAVSRNCNYITSALRPISIFQAVQPCDSLGRGGAEQ